MRGDTLKRSRHEYDVDFSIDVPGFRHELDLEKWTGSDLEKP